jgi:ABC-type sulfate/molybdate transport systems ATPase subunit
MHADRILVLHEGRVVQLGDHATLARAPGPYRRLCEIQGALDASIRADVAATGASAKQTEQSRRQERQER